MPKEPTPRLKLKNPSTGEFDWDKDWWENTGILDNHPGIRVVTNTSLPREPWQGQLVFNLDELSLLVWTGEHWLNLSSAGFDYLQAGPGGIKAGRVIYAGEDGLAHHADQSLAAHYVYRILGISILDTPAGEMALVKKSGIVKCPDWKLLRGREYYLGEDGVLVETKPAASTLTVVAGVALAPDTLSVRIMPG